MVFAKIKIQHLKYLFPITIKKTGNTKHTQKNYFAAKWQFKYQSKNHILNRKKK